ncbi:RNA-binding protein [Lewinellaceae bacterium SD302]|nr:RNA-binding protein [Lewinellaceae bacterium SD302]
MKNTLLICLLLGLGSLSAQDDCASAVDVFTGLTYVDTLTGVQVTDIDCLGPFSGNESGWFTYLATADTTIRVATGGFPESTGSDTRFSVYTGNCDSLVCLGGDDDSGPVYTSIFDFEVSAGTVYYLVFNDRWENDPFVINIEEVFIPPSLVDFTTVQLNREGTFGGVVDMNGDFLDDIVSSTSDTIHVQYQQADATFTEAYLATPVADHTNFWSLTAGDLNGDGLNDLIYGGGSGTTFMITDGNEGFTEYSPDYYIFCQRGNTVDLNNDGVLDVFMCHDVEPNVYFINQNDGEFSLTQGGIGDTENGGNYGSIWLDYDNDGDQDMFIAKCRGGNSDARINQLHRNNGDGTFTEVGAELNLADTIQTWSAAVGDYDNDGDMDIFVGASSLGNDYHRLMRNDGDVFTDVSAGSGLEVNLETSRENKTHDFNNDGYLDILGGGSDIWINNGDMTFVRTLFAGPNGAVGDLNNDGFLDVVGTGGGDSRIYLNEGNDNNWIKINAIGTASNLNGIGARVELYTTSGQQIRDIRGGDGFEFMSSLNVHFGIGENTNIDKLVVKWPSGIVDEIFPANINTTITVIEGESPSSISGFAPLDVAVYPNPAANELFLPLELVVEKATVDVFDVNGRLLIRRALTSDRIDLNNFPAGSYQLIYRNGAEIRVGKFVKR